MNLDKLNIPITADDRSLRAALTRSRAGIKTFAAGTSTDLVKVQGSMARLRSMTVSTRTAMARMSGVLGGIGLIGTTLFVKRMAAVADEIDTTATAIGITAEELQELRYAAGQVGIEQSRVTQSMSFFTKALGQAIQGTGEARRGLDELGIGLDEIRGKAPLDVLTMVAEKLKAIQNPLRRNAILAQLFGRSGLEMAALIGQGGEALDDYREKARRLGLVVSNDMVKRAAAASAEFKTLGAVFSTAGINLAAEFLPALRSLAETITTPAFQQGVKDFATNIGDLVRWIADNIDVIERFGVAFVAMRGGAAMGGALGGRRGAVAGGAVGGAMGYIFGPDAIANLSAETDAIAAMRGELEALDQQIEDRLSMKGVIVDGDLAGTAHKIVAMKKQREELAAQIEDAVRMRELEIALAKKAQGFRAETKPSGPVDNTGLSDAEIAARTAAWEKQTAAFISRTDALALEAETVGMSQREIEKRRVALQLEQQLERAGLELTAERKVQIEQLSERYADQVEVLARVQEQQQRVDQAAMASFESVKSGFKDLILEGKSFADVLADVASRLADIALDAAFDAMFRPGTGGDTGGAGGGIFATIAQFLTSFSDGGYTGQGGRLEPAGVVHKGEFVFDQKAVRRIGVGALEAARRGFADGGYVGAPGPISDRQPVCI